MFNRLGDLKKTLDESFGSPREGIRLLSEFTSGESGKKLDRLLSKIENISKDSSNIPQVIELLKLIQQMNQTGALDKLIKLLGSIPKGKSGEAMVTELRKVITEIVPRLDKLSALASALMKED